MLPRMISVRCQKNIGLLSAIVACVTLVSFPAHGADILPIGPLDASGSGRVASPGSIERGGIIIRATSESLHHVDVKKGSEAPASRIGRIDRHHIFLGLGLSRNVSLTLGMGGTAEDIPDVQRLSLFADQKKEDFADQDRIARTHFKLDFAGASLAVKWNLINRTELNGLSLSLMPFLESGAGAKATYSLSRAVEPKGGAALLAALGSEGTGELGTSLGIRYRSPEAVAGQMMRHELFYKTYAILPITGGLSLFGDGEGRQIMVAAPASDDSEHRNSKPSYGGDARLGLKIRVAGLMLSAYGGRRLGPVTGLGYASRSLGASVALLLGKASRDRRPLSYATMIEREEERKAKVRHSSSPAIIKVDQQEDVYTEMIGTEIDPLDALGPDEAPDFKDVKKRMEEERVHAGKESEDARIERELIELKEAEAKVAAERAKQKAKDDAEALREARKESAEDAQNFKKWVDEANEDLKDMDVIQPEDMQWNGLEEP